MPIVFNDRSLSRGIETAGSALAGAIQQRGQKRNAERGLSEFSDSLSQSDGTPQSIRQAYTNAINQGADPAQLQFLKEEHKQAIESNAVKSAYDFALEKGGFNTPEGQSSFVDEYIKSGGDPMKALSMFNKKPGTQSVFDKKIDEFKADSVINYIQGGESTTKTLEDNLEFLGDEIENVGRAKGAVTGEFLWNSAKFTEYRNRGNLVLDGVIKVFNKAGVLPQRKLEWIRDTFAVSPWDTQDQIKGKIQSLQSLVKDSAEFNNQMGSLIDRHGENIPNSEFMKIQKNLSNSIDRLENQNASGDGQKIEKVNKLSSSGYKKGDLAMNEKTGKGYIFNGERWVEKKEQK